MLTILLLGPILYISIGIFYSSMVLTKEIINEDREKEFTDKEVISMVFVWPKYIRKLKRNEDKDGSGR